MTDTPMTVKQFLNHVRCQQNKLNSLRREQILIRQDIADIKGQRYDKDKISGSKQSDLCDLVIRLDDRLHDSDARVAYQIAVLHQLRQQAIRMILSIDDEEIQAIMFDRYVNNLTWQQIITDRTAGLQGDYLDRTIYRRHGIGLQMLVKTYGDCVTPDNRVSDCQ